MILAIKIIQKTRKSYDGKNYSYITKILIESTIIKLNQRSSAKMPKHNNMVPGHGRLTKK